MELTLKKIPDKASPESPATRAVVAGNLIFINSIDGMTDRDCESDGDGSQRQLIVCLEKIRLLLEQLGSSIKNLVKMTILLKQAEDLPRLWGVMSGYYRHHAPELLASPPAVTIAQVEALGSPESFLEIDALCVVSLNYPGWEVVKRASFTRDDKRIIQETDSLPQFFSESVSVGNLIFLSGMSGEDPATGRFESTFFEHQWVSALDKINAALDRAGCTMSNIIKTLHFLCESESAPEQTSKIKRSHSVSSDRLWRVELDYFDRHAPYLLEEFPGSTFLKVSSLSNRQALGQNEVIAVHDRFRPGWEVKKYPTYIGRRGFPRHIGDIKKYYSNVIQVGNLLYVSGQTATNNISGIIESSVFEDQLWVVLKNMRDSLEEAGSSMENLIKTYILLPDPSFLGALRQLEKAFFKKYAPRLLEEPPVSTVIHPYNLASSSMLVEIEAVACLPSI